MAMKGQLLTTVLELYQSFCQCRHCGLGGLQRTYSIQYKMVRGAVRVNTEVAQALQLEPAHHI